MLAQLLARILPDSVVETDSVSGISEDSGCQAPCVAARPTDGIGDAGRTVRHSPPFDRIEPRQLLSNRVMTPANAMAASSAAAISSPTCASVSWPASTRR